LRKLDAGNSVHCVWNDFHKPYEDTVALRVAEKLIKHIQPDYIHYNGDIIDFYPISKFDKKPRMVAEIQKELDDVQAMLQYHSNIFKKAKKFYLLGNHEDRLRRYLWSVAKELSELRCLEIGELLDLDKFDIRMIDYEEGLLVNDSFLIIHGNIVRKNSGYTARGLMEKHGGCGICGHTHRGGSHYHRDRFGERGWWENWCLCTLNPDYIQFPDWQQGISIIQFIGKQFFVEQLPIIDGKCVYGGKLYTSDDK
jgi:predicted phosphodiesterase